MEKNKNKFFTTAGIFSTILILSAVMGLAGNFQTGGFTPFIIINSLSLLALLFLSIVLFMKKDNILLGIALICNTVVSLLSVCFAFTLQELFICLTFASLTISYFIKDHTTSFKQFVILEISLLGSFIVIFSMIGFVKHLINTIKSLDTLYIFDLSKFMFYFMPFIYASLNCVLVNLLALIINDSSIIYNKKNIVNFIPLFIIALTTIASLIIAMMKPTLDLTINSFSEVFLIIIGILATLAILSSSFILVLPKTKQIEENK